MIHPKEDLRARGPTFDGRIKPELTAPTEIRTTSNDGGYTPAETLKATSFASPQVTGSIAVLEQFYQDEMGVNLEPGRAYAIMINTASGTSTSAGGLRMDNNIGAGTIDLHRSGVATQTGVVSVSSGEEKLHTINVPFGTSKIIATAWWPEDHTFHNDVDLWLEDPDGNFVVSSNVNTIVERVIATDLLAFGDYTLKIQGYNVTQAPQEVWFAYTVITPPIVDAGSDINAVENTQIKLDGSASHTTNGASITEWNWEQLPTSAPILSVINNGSPDPIVTIPGVSTDSTAIFQLQTCNEFNTCSENQGASNERVLVHISDSGVGSASINNPFPTTKDKFGFSVDLFGPSSNLLAGAPEKDFTSASSSLTSQFEISSQYANSENTDSLINVSDLLRFSFDDTTQTGHIFDLRDLSTPLVTIPSHKVYYYDDAKEESPQLTVMHEENNKILQLTSKNNETLLTVSSPDILANDNNIEKQIPIKSKDASLFINENTGNSYIFDGTSGELLMSTTNNVGGAYLIDSNSNTLLTIENPTPESNEEFGTDVKSFGTNKIAVSSPRDKVGGSSGVGSIYIFDGMQSGTTSTPLFTVNNPSPNPFGGDKFGKSLAFSDDNSKIIVGEPGDSNPYSGDSAGTVHVYDGTATNTISIPILSITNSDPDFGDNFGWSVDWFADKVVVGSPDDNNISLGGSVRIYDGTLSGTTSSPILTIQNPDPVAGDKFGQDVAVMNNQYVLVGSPEDDNIMGTDTGAIYIFNGTVSGILNTPLLTIYNPDPGSDDDFGESVDSIGDLIFAGAPGNTVNGISGAGSVYLFDGRLRGVTDQPLLTLNNDNPQNNDEYGFSVSTSGNKYLIGIPRDDSFGTDTGRIFNFAPTIIMPTVPDMPTSLIANVTSYNKIVLDWNEPSTDGGYSIAGYKIERELVGSGIDYETLEESTGDQSTVYSDISNLLPNTQYKYRVSAINALGTGNTSNVASTTTLDYGIISTTTYTNPSSNNFNFFGDSISLNEQHVLVGAFRDTLGLPTSTVGAAYLFDSDNASGQLPLHTIQNPTIGTNNVTQHFGQYTEILGNGLIAVSLDRDVVDQVSAGSVYIYDPVTGNQSDVISNPNPGHLDRFGRSIDALGTNKLVIGAPLDDPNGNADVGSAYVYDTATQAITNMTNPNQVPGFEFGTAVTAFDDGKVAVSGKGQVYVFDANGDLMSSIIDPIDPSTTSWFGNSIAAIGDDMIAVSDFAQNFDPLYVVGEVYIFNATDGSPIMTIPNPYPTMLDFFGHDIGVFDNDTKLAVSVEDDTSNSHNEIYIFDISTGKNLLKLTTINGDGIDSDQTSIASLVDDPVIALHTWGFAHKLEFGSVVVVASAAVSSSGDSSLIASVDNGVISSKPFSTNTMSQLMQKDTGLFVQSQQQQYSNNDSEKKLNILLNLAIFADFYTLYQKAMNEKNLTDNIDNYKMPFAISSSGDTIWFVSLDDKNSKLQISSAKNIELSHMYGHEVQDIVSLYIDSQVTSDELEFSNSKYIVFSKNIVNKWHEINAILPSSDLQNDKKSIIKIKMSQLD